LNSDRISIDRYANATQMKQTIAQVFDFMLNVGAYFGLRDECRMLQMSNVRELMQVMVRISVLAIGIASSVAASEHPCGPGQEFARHVRS
jgi:hypothetical protein